MALAITTITASIAALSVSGVTMRDTTAIPKKVDERECPIFYPKPDGFVTGLTVERNSFGPDSQARKTVRYTLNYVFLHSKIGTDRAGVFENYGSLVTKAFAILDVLIANSTVTGAVDLTVPDVLNFGPLTDPLGTWFNGCEIPISVMEFVN